MIVLVSLAGIGSAAESFSSLAFLQAGESTITNGTDDMMVITVHAVDPQMNVTRNGNITQVPPQFLQYTNRPSNAVLVFPHEEMTSVSIVSIANLSFSDDNTTLTLQVQPLDYYDGGILSSYAEGQMNLHQFPQKTSNETRLYVEIKKYPPENGWTSGSGCNICVENSQGDYRWIGMCDVVC